MVNLAIQTLDQLVTWNGIYASTAKGKEGVYYAYFGRDSAEVTNSLLQAALLEGDIKNNIFLRRAVSGLINLIKWQGTHDDPETGMQLGKFPHEIRTDSRFYSHLTVKRKREGNKSWYLDPRDYILKNWDSNDATPFITSVIFRLHEVHFMEITDELEEKIKSALNWCIRNIKEHHGLAGFSRCEDRTWGGLTNHGWKDSEYAYLLNDGNKPCHPIHDVLVNAHMWEAFKRGAHFFSHKDKLFSQQLEDEAINLKKLFNDEKKGFLFYDKENGLYYFAEARDVNGNKLETICADPAMALASYVGKECVIEDKYIPHIVKRIMKNDMCDHNAGIRTYCSSKGPYDQTGGYHRGPNTFWPFVSGRIGEGLHNFKFTNEAKSVLAAMINGVQKFNTCIELFLKKDDNYLRFQDEQSGQTSCTDQAWTAARLYYAVRFLEHLRSPPAKN